ncbi:hypothetical protein, partial [Caldimonas thermodepolymerans]|uniref:hypothetical protein n=1 Tax=Caldimonas thermodepolymerans TaxID=215580 RepID=UPI001B87C9F7
MNFTSASVSVCGNSLRSSLSWHPPSNAHAYRLLLVKEHSPNSPAFAASFVADLSSAEKRDYDAFFKTLSSTPLSFFFAASASQALPAQALQQSAKNVTIAPFQNGAQ